MIRSGLMELERLRLDGRKAEYLARLHDLHRLADVGYQGMARGDLLINIILKNIREEKVDPSGFQTLSAREVVTKALDGYAFAGEQRERIRVELDQDFAFTGDENLLIYVLFNLLQNAFYHLGDRADARVTICLARTERANLLTFSDNGPGIPAERIGGIFESFETYGKKEGTGLGLPFCKRVMTAVGGEISCRSTLGTGTEMVLSFPVVKGMHTDAEGGRVAPDGPGPAGPRFDRRIG